MTWEDGIFGKIPSAEWLSVPFDVRRQADPSDMLFGDEKTDNLTASWQTINAMYQVPETAHFHAFDTEAGTAYRIPVDNHHIEKGLIKVKINQSERLQALLNSGVRSDDLFRYVVDDAMRLSEQVATRTKVAKNEVLATGKFTIRENNLNLVVDYGVTEEQTDFEIDFAKEADVPSQIQEIIDTASDMGITLTGIYTSRRFLTKIRSHTSVQTAVNGVNSAGALVSNSGLTAYLADEFGITQVITNDGVYNADSKIDSDGRPIVTTKRYYPDDKITFFGTTSNGRIGTGLWGNPPEALDTLMSATTSAESPYIYISQWTEKDPAVLWTKASGLFVPVIYNPSSIFIATAKNSDNSAKTVSNTKS